jgi:hypothetical protein
MPELMLFPYWSLAWALKVVVDPSPRVREVDGEMVTEVSVGGELVIEMVAQDGPLTVPEYVPLTQMVTLPVVVPAVKVTAVPVDAFKLPNAVLDRVQLKVVDEVSEPPLVPSEVAPKALVPLGVTPTVPDGEIATEASDTVVLTVVGSDACFTRLL